MSDDTTLDDLRAECDATEAELLAVQTEYDQRREDLRAEYGPRIKDLGAQAGKAQKKALNREVLESLRDRPDRWAVLDSLMAQGWDGAPPKTEIKAVLGGRDG